MKCFADLADPNGRRKDEFPRNGAFCNGVTARVEEPLLKKVAHISRFLNGLYMFMQRKGIVSGRFRSLCKGFLAADCHNSQKLTRMVAGDDEQKRIEHSQNGDHQAFEELVREHQQMIHALCYRMTGSMADAQDLAQETFIQCFHHLGSFRGESRFSSWLYRIAMNQCLNWQKARGRREHLHRSWSEQARSEEQVGDDVGQPIQEALLKLDAKQRAAIVLTTYDGLNHAEAARVLGCSETTVSWRLFAARRKLKTLLKQLRREEVG
jgi:RNA polymerase sigma-70 factor, ECF subfamily